jgi:hypothetical protein
MARLVLAFLQRSNLLPLPAGQSATDPGASPPTCPRGVEAAGDRASN